MGAGAPVVVCALAEESEQAIGVRGKKLRLLFGDAAGGVCGVVAEGGVSREERAKQRLEELRFGEDLRGGAARVSKTPGWDVEMQGAAIGLGHLGGSRAQYKSLQFSYL